MFKYDRQLDEQADQKENQWGDKEHNSIGSIWSDKPLSNCQSIPNHDPSI